MGIRVTLSTIILSGPHPIQWTAVSITCCERGLNITGERSKSKKHVASLKLFFAAFLLIQSINVKFRFWAIWLVSQRASSLGQLALTSWAARQINRGRHCDQNKYGSPHHCSPRRSIFTCRHRLHVESEGIFPHVVITVLHWTHASNDVWGHSKPWSAPICRLEGVGSPIRMWLPSVSLRATTAPVLTNISVSGEGELNFPHSGDTSSTGNSYWLSKDRLMFVIPPMPKVSFTLDNIRPPSGRLPDLEMIHESASACCHCLSFMNHDASDYDTFSILGRPCVSSQDHRCNGELKTTSTFNVAVLNLHNNGSKATGSNEIYTVHMWDFKSLHLEFIS